MLIIKNDFGLKPNSYTYKLIDKLTNAEHCKIKVRNDENMREVVETLNILGTLIISYGENSIKPFSRAFYEKGYLHISRGSRFYKISDNFLKICLEYMCGYLVHRKEIVSVLRNTF